MWVVFPTVALNSHFPEARVLAFHPFPTSSLGCCGWFVCKFGSCHGDGFLGDLEGGAYGVVEAWRTGQVSAWDSGSSSLSGWVSNV